MKIDKEYPATHSMSTAWFCVDEDGNVGIFDIEDNGPVPVGGYTQDGVEDVFWDDFSVEEGEVYKTLNLLEEQILPMLIKDDKIEEWVKAEYGSNNFSWMNTIIKIDMEKLDIFKEAISFDRNNFRRPICLSKKLGLFYVDFFSNKEGVELLEKNDVVIEKYRAPLYVTPDDLEKGDNKPFIEVCQRFPLYLYLQDYWPFARPAKRLNHPGTPMKISQLPKEIQTKIKKLPLKFKDTERIQLAELVPVDVSGCPEYVYDNKIWNLLKLSDGNCGYYCMKTHKIIPESEFKTYLEEGKAEEYDYKKHHHLEKKND